jgi:cation diffusion facilitator CzcD-associated flavoprotein CzcO
MPPELITTPPAFDPDTLRDRYRRERDKRLRTDGYDQYVELDDSYARYLDDPYVPRVERAPRHDTVEVIVIGGGFAGLVTGAKLRQAGIDDFLIIEKGGGLGGTWYWNRYPGAQCDIESYIYLPLLEETGYMPTEKYAMGPEILEHCNRIADKFGLVERAVLSTEVTGLEWDPSRSSWLVRTNRGDELVARFVTIGNGPLHRPKLPGIPGLEEFGGHTFHTSRWDYDYTGGDSSGGLTGLSDKTVGIIGTGATAVQVVPRVGEAAKQTFVFQRTPSSIDVRNNQPTDPEWVATLSPGWQQERIENFTVLTSSGQADKDLVMDAWTDIVDRLFARRGADGPSREDAEALQEMVDFEKMEQIRARVDEVVNDPDTAAALKPWYRYLCKRPCFHDEYLQTFNRPNVQLVDTDGRGVERVTRDGVVVAGKEYQLDCLIFATGFEVGTEFVKRAGFDVVGVGGVKLSEHWSDGIKSMFGMHIHGFPNLFMIGHDHAAFSVNYAHMLSEGASHMAYILQNAVERGVREIEVTAEAEKEWTETINRSTRRFRAFVAQCTPGYYNHEGKLGQQGEGLVTNAYGKGPAKFFELTAKWRAAGDFAGLDMRR